MAPGPKSIALTKGGTRSHFSETLAAKRKRYRMPKARRMPTTTFGTNAARTPHTPTSSKSVETMEAKRTPINIIANSVVSANFRNTACITFHMCVTSSNSAPEHTSQQNASNIMVMEWIVKIFTCKKQVIAPVKTVVCRKCSRIGITAIPERWLLTAKSYRAVVTMMLAHSHATRSPSRRRNRVCQSSKPCSVHTPCNRSNASSNAHCCSSRPKGNNTNTPPIATTVLFKNPAFLQHNGSVSTQRELPLAADDGRLAWTAKAMYDKNTSAIIHLTNFWYAADANGRLSAFHGSTPITKNDSGVRSSTASRWCEPFKPMSHPLS
mmetsp:Transcript_95627/g.276287  ORF Transcript_95627/g.276287 Transcript_95627/m.276287 type:complete len:323 (-) Transcript_95627:1125-2093(-)